ncbi:MAG: preprotein translocase subunit YajC [Oscillospiraceae bacterium]|nr:preprotein translocase subunit YajC [Oscillospiraceae bacterium]
MNFIPVLETAQATNQASTGSSLLTMLLTFLPILLIFYFFIIRPQKKKDKEDKNMRESLSIGDEIVTIGGIVGIVTRQTEDTVVIETGGDRSKLRIQKWAIKENITALENKQAAANPPAAVPAADIPEKKEKKSKKSKNGSEEE